MSKVKVGDWVEVTKIDRQDTVFNIFIGEVFQVLEVLSDDGVEVELRNGMTWWFRIDQFRKVSSMSTMWRKRPVQVEVIRFLADNFSDVMKFTNDTAHSFVDNTCIIPTLEGEHIATAGDFIIKGIKGEFYPCKPDVFMKTYEKV